MEGQEDFFILFLEERKINIHLISCVLFVPVWPLKHFSVAAE